MALVARKRKNKTVYHIAVWWKGEQYWEAAGSDKREARRLEARRKREVKDGTYVPPNARSGGITIKGYAERFFAGRTNRNKESERRQVELHALSIPWFADMRMDDARPPHFLKLVQEIRAKKVIVDGVPKRVLGEKALKNVYGTIRTMFGDAVFNEIVPHNPCMLPRGTIKAGSKERPAYRGADVQKLLSERVSVKRRLFIWLAFFSGMREGEICGRRFRDWIRDASPLTALICDSQYNDQPLKGDEEEGETRPRVIPVHPKLQEMLEWWWAEGWELVYCKRPTLDDWIVPNLYHPERNQTKSSGYKLWRKACDEADVVNTSLHSTRHTFTTFARRGSPREDVIEAITHNSKAKGKMIDWYNHWQWGPLCEVMSALDFGADANDRHPLRLRKAASAPGSSDCDQTGSSNTAEPRTPSEGSGRLLRAAGDGLSDEGDEGPNVDGSVDGHPQVCGIIVEAPGIEQRGSRRILGQAA
ncbi:MAG: tyrosine-type recombinase/integrase [Myxococcota bacterium]